MIPNTSAPVEIWRRKRWNTRKVVNSINKIMWLEAWSGVFAVIRSLSDAAHHDVFVSFLGTGRIRPGVGPIDVSGVAQCNKIVWIDIQMKESIESWPVALKCVDSSSRRRELVRIWQCFLAELFFVFFRYKWILCGLRVCGAVKMYCLWPKWCQYAFV